MVAIFSWFNEKEIPTESFIVIEVPGMAANANLDTRNLDKGCLILMKQNEDLSYFYEWCEKSIVKPFFRNLLQSCFSISSTDAESNAFSLAGRIWVDSDMRYMARLVSLALMQENCSKGLDFSNVAAKLTWCYKPMDVGSFFKVIKSCCRLCMSKKCQLWETQ